MTDIDRLDQRLSAVERVVVDGDLSLDELEELTSLAETVTALETRIGEQEQRLADLEAGIQSIEGYVGNVESINDDVERQAASAVATVDRLERRVQTLELELDEIEGGLLEAERERDDENESTSEGSDEDASDPVATDEYEAIAFEFGTVTETRADPTPEQSMSEIVGGTDESTSIVDDGADRPGSSANQETVETALDGTADAATSTRGGSDTDSDTDTDGGLFASLRGRFP